ncbi:MAG TPA: hypothetical protein VFF79_11915 [Conexibacter sp.]|nr:hypothetical protein [Conexibacter sp.]
MNFGVLGGEARWKEVTLRSQESLAVVRPQSVGILVEPGAFSNVDVSCIGAVLGFGEKCRVRIEAIPGALPELTKMRAKAIVTYLVEGEVETTAFPVRALS